MSRSPTDRKRRRSSAVRRRRSVSAESSGREQRRRRAGDASSNDDSHGHSTDSRRPHHRRSTGTRTTRRRSRTESSVTLSKDAASSPSADSRVQTQGHARPAHRRHASSSAKLPQPGAGESAALEPRRDRAPAPAPAPAKTPVSAAAAASITPGAGQSERHGERRGDRPKVKPAEKLTSKPAGKPANRPGDKPLKAPPRPEPDSRSAPAPDPQSAPDFGLSGKLAAEANAVNGVVLKYTEPPEARRPRHRWRIYVFKDAKDIDMHHIDAASAYLFGRDRKVADIPIDHPSCSSQHAVLQYRQSDPNTVRPYIIDLNSTNGTFLNGDKLPVQRYVELRSEDVIRFGFSTREYVVLREK